MEVLQFPRTEAQVLAYHFGIYPQNGDPCVAFGMTMADQRTIMWMVDEPNPPHMSTEPGIKAWAAKHKLDAYQCTDTSIIPAEIKSQMDTLLGWLGGGAQSVEAEPEPEPEPTVREPDYYDLSLAAESLTPEYSDSGGQAGLMDRVSEGAKGLVGRFRRSQ